MVLSEWKLSFTPSAPDPRPCSEVAENLRALAGHRACDANSAAALPAKPGAYLLLVRLTKPLPLRLSTLGAAVLPAGRYVYAGNARGPGGIRARVARHLRHSKRQHWHIDHLTEVADCWAFAVPGGRECDLVQSLLAQPGYEVAITGFGSSDCRRCASHLLTEHPA